MQVLEFAAELPMEALFYPDGLYKLNKKILRDLATKLGFRYECGTISDRVAPMFAKKAIQFGTKVAQQYNRLIFDSHRKAKGWRGFGKK